MNGLFGAIVRPRADLVESLPMDEWLRRMSGGVEASSGVDVSPETAVRYATVAACVRVLAESVASLPCILYRRRKDGGKDRATDHPLYRVLHSQANAWNTSFEYFEGQMGNLALRGNGYALVERNRRGQTMGLIPLNPDGVTIDQAADWSPIYTATLPNNTRRRLQRSELHHIRGPFPKGYVGQSMIGIAREAVGLGVAAERFGAGLFKKGLLPSGVLEHPGEVGPEAVETLRGQFEERYSGSSNSHRPLVLEEGMKWTALSVKPDEAQFLETRKFQRQEICGIFRVPAHMVADLERSTNNNIEHQSLEFVIHSLRPWLERWEQAIERDLLTPVERAEGYFVEFLVDALLRGDTKSRYEAYASAIQNKWLNANEVRELENRNPRDGGDAYENPAIQVKPPAAGDAAATTKAA